jgi:predicted kinase
VPAGYDPVVERRPECVILVGLPAAGKSTLARRRFPGHEIVSKDAFPASARNKQARQDAQLRAALTAGRSVVVDNTNATPADRAAVITLARELGASVTGIYIEVSPRVAVARNAQRTGRAKVPKVAIFTCAKRLVPPLVSEGFDVLETVRVQPDGSV